MAESAHSSRLRLEKIKLVGFKSFVEPTTIELPSNLIGIVGPNGCGKSNIIDAVRWVMGESSAKNLRGASMADVIFNGSTNRQPVGQASIELTFNNPDGRLGGEYARFSQIVIRREVTRDGQSHYYLNHTRCRRRDITDIFLGTGLGPRSYAIIGQGTILGLVEAKPEELRVYLEEAAGISKYKERRRETETRMRHTRENLARLTDIREELQQQLNHLQRQAQTAERYQLLKADEKRLELTILALRWQSQATQQETLVQQLHQAALTLEMNQATLTKVETQTETLRDQHQTQADALQNLQENYYTIREQVSGLEQAIQYQQQRQQQLEQDQLAIQQALAACTEDSANSQVSIQAHEVELQQLEPILLEATARQQELQKIFEMSEQSLNEWRHAWDVFQRESHQAQQQAQIHQAEIQHLEHRLQALQQRSLRCRETIDHLDPQTLQHAIEELQVEVDTHQALREQLKLTQQSQQQQLQILRQNLETERLQLQHQQQLLQQETGRLASLEALQQAALGNEQGEEQTWLTAQQLVTQPRLGEIMQVVSGWELAVEMVLADHLQAVCVTTIDDLQAVIPELASLNLRFWQTNNQYTVAATPQRLSTVVTADATVIAWLDTVWLAETLSEALARRQLLAPHESIITRDGIWLGRYWLRIYRQDSVKAGIFAREKTIQATRETQTVCMHQMTYHQTRITDLTEQLRAMEQQLESSQHQWQQAHHHWSEVNAQLQVKQHQLHQLYQRQEQLEAELTEYGDEMTELQTTLLETRHAWQIAMTRMQAVADQDEQLQSDKLAVQSHYEQTKQLTQEIRHQVQALQLQWQRVTTELAAKRDLLVRSQAQQSQYQQRLQTLVHQQTELLDPLDDKQVQLDQLLDQHLAIEAELHVARQQLQQIEQQLRSLETQRQAAYQALQQQQDLHQQLVVDKRAFEVRQANIEEQLVEYQMTIQVLLEEVSLNLQEPEVQLQLQRVKQQLQRLGPINLAAIDEFAIQNERKIHLDSQVDDLSQALETLEAAIRKIDRETRQRFKTTYETVNKAFQTLFPKIFEGGSAALELTGEDLLDTGVIVTARPPGKKNTTIHLLSGGEKALTAIALVFAIFQLNPAPFCMLDEVDAPLDDQNVRRYARLVQAMSQDVQFIFISHNKLAIEMAEHLIGVTMREPGVSRMVSVNIQEAIHMATN